MQIKLKRVHILSVSLSQKKKMARGICTFSKGRAKLISIPSIRNDFGLEERRSHGSFARNRIKPFMGYCSCSFMAPN